MIDFLSSPILFPSDMDSPKLTAGPNFKLPEPTNWADHDYYNTMTDKSIASLADLIKLEPVKENDIHVYLPFLISAISPKITSILNQKTAIGGLDDDYSQPLTLLAFAQSMVHAYALPLSLPTGINKQKNDMDDIYCEGQSILRDNIRGVFDVVENDMQRNGHYSLYLPLEQQNGNVNSSTFYHDDISDDWSWRDGFIDVPDLVHSTCSSPSPHSLVGNHQSSTPVLLESGISSQLNDGCPRQHMGLAITDIIPSYSSSNTTQQADGKKKNKIFKNWVVKMRQTTSNMKQNCAKSLSNTSRKLCQWIKD